MSARSVERMVEVVTPLGTDSRAWIMSNIFGFGPEESLLLAVERRAAPPAQPCGDPGQPPQGSAL